MKPIDNIPVGASATRSVKVTRELTVAHFHPGMPEVYGTPLMISSTSARPRGVSNATSSTFPVRFVFGFDFSV